MCNRPTGEMCNSDNTLKKNYEYGIICVLVCFLYLLFIILNLLYTVILEYILEFIGLHLTNNAILV